MWIRVPASLSRKAPASLSQVFGRQAGRAGRSVSGASIPPSRPVSPGSVACSTQGRQHAQHLGSRARLSPQSEVQRAWGVAALFCDSSSSGTIFPESNSLRQSRPSSALHATDVWSRASMSSPYWQPAWAASLGEGHTHHHALSIDNLGVHHPLGGRRSPRTAITACSPEHIDTHDAVASHLCRADVRSTGEPRPT